MPIVVFVLVILIEIGIFGYCLNIEAPSKIQWQLTARYSARISFGLLFISQTLMWLKGFRYRQKLFRTFVFAFVVNHIIHLFYLMYVMYLSDWAFHWLRHLLAGTAYVVLLFWIVHYFTKGTDSTKNDWFSWILCFHSGVIFVITYLGRYMSELMLYANRIVYLALLILSILGLFLQVLAYYNDRKNIKLS